MSKVYGIFILNHTKPLLDSEIQALIIQHLASTQLSYILRKYPNKSWDYDYLSENPNITLDFIFKNLDKKWNFTQLILNPNLSTKDKLLLCEKFD